MTRRRPGRWRGRWDLNEGQCQPVARTMAAQGLLLRTADPRDARRQTLRLTDKGRDALQMLAEGARRALATHLPSEARQTLIADLLDQVQAIWQAAPPDLTDLQPGDAGWVIARHGALYARDEGYGPAFRGAGGAESLRAFCPTGRT